MQKLSLTIKFCTILGICVLGVLSLGFQTSVSPEKIWYINNLVTWLPDESKSVVGKIATIDTQTNHTQVVVQAPDGHLIGDARFSPDGKHLVYRTVAPDDVVFLWQANSDGTNPQEIAHASLALRSIWLSDTQLLILKGNKREGLDWQTFSWQDDSEPELYNTVTRTSQPVILKTDIRDFGIAFSSEHQPTKLFLESAIGFAHLKAEGNTITQVPEMILDVSKFPKISGTRLPSQTPDGKRTAFVASFGFNQIVDEIFLATDNGQSVRRVTHLDDDYGGVHINTAGISPNGKWASFTTGVYYPHPLDRPQGPGAYLALANLDNGKVELVAIKDNPGYVPLVWSPDSRYAVTSLFVPGLDYSPPELYALDVQNKTVKQLTFDGGRKTVIAWR